VEICVFCRLTMDPREIAKNGSNPVLIRVTKQEFQRVKTQSKASLQSLNFMQPSNASVSCENQFRHFVFKTSNQPISNSRKEHQDAKKKPLKTKPYQRAPKMLKVDSSSGKGDYRSILLEKSLVDAELPNPLTRKLSEFPSSPINIQQEQPENSLMIETLGSPQTSIHGSSSPVEETANVPSDIFDQKNDDTSGYDSLANSSSTIDIQQEDDGSNDDPNILTVNSIPGNTNFSRFINKRKDNNASSNLSNRFPSIQASHQLIPSTVDSEQSIDDRSFLNNSRSTNSDHHELFSKENREENQ
jgi:hypothetical protein